MTTGTAQQMFIGGDWQPSATGETFEATSPANGAVIGTVPQGDRDDARRAIEAARAAADGWARLTAFERAAKMHAIGDIIASRRDALAQTLTLDQGKPLRAEAYDEVDELIEYWRMAAEDAKRLGGELPNSFSPGKRVMLMRRPRGVAGIISPWNWPYTMPARADRAGARRAATRSCGRRRRRRRCARSRSPNASPRPTCRQACSTSSPDRARSSAMRSRGTRASMRSASSARRSPAATSRPAAAGKGLVLEMGGNGPLVVMDDADVDAAVEATLVACYLCAGQSCTAGERILVHRAVQDEFVEKLARAVTERILLGDPFDDATTMGPVNNEGVAVKMDEHVADAVERGASIVTGGSRANAYATDLYWEPTILAGVPADARVATDETFGPIAPVVAIDSLEQAIELTNASPYGLLAAIFTADIAAGLQFADRVHTGWVNINESTNYWESHLPFGGRSGTDTGIGRVGGNYVMQSFTELQTVVVTPSRPAGGDTTGH